MKTHKLKLHRLAFIAVLIGGSLTVAKTVVAEEMKTAQALAIRAEDPNLEWGGCPDTVFKDPGCQIAVLQGNPAEPNADVFLRVPGKYKIPSHWHTSAERMILVAGRMEVTYEGQDKAVLTPGSYAYGPPKAPHSAVCTSSKPCVLFIAFELPVDAHPVSE